MAGMPHPRGTFPFRTNELVQSPLALEPAQGG